MKTAAEYYQDAHDSFERCDTDGFMSQWASNIMGDKARLQEEVNNNGGMWDFEILCDLDGNPVPAKIIKTRFGHAYAIFASFDKMEYGDPIIKWVNLGLTDKTLAKKGYKMGIVTLPAKVILSGNDVCNVRAVIVRK